MASLNGGTILLGGSQLAINHAITIDASVLPDGITVDAEQRSRVFEIEAEAGAPGVRLRSLKITGGKADDGQAGTSLSDLPGGDGSEGGGIYNSGMLSLHAVSVSGNFSGDGGAGFGGGFDSWSAGQGGRGGSGGGIYNVGVLDLTESSVSENAAGRGGDGGRGGNEGGHGREGGSGRGIFNPTFGLDPAGGVSFDFSLSSSADPATIWIVRRSSDLRNFSEIYRFDGSADTRAAGISFTNDGNRVSVSDPDLPGPVVLYRLEVELGE